MTIEPRRLSPVLVPEIKPAAFTKKLSRPNSYQLSGLVPIDEYTGRTLEELLVSLNASGQIGILPDLHDALATRKFVSPEDFVRHFGEGTEVLFCGSSRRYAGNLAFPAVRVEGNFVVTYWSPLKKIDKSIVLVRFADGLLATN